MNISSITLTIPPAGFMEGFGVKRVPVPRVTSITNVLAHPPVVYLLATAEALSKYQRSSNPRKGGWRFAETLTEYLLDILPCIVANLWKRNSCESQRSAYSSQTRSFGLEIDIISHAHLLCLIKGRVGWVDGLEFPWRIYTHFEAIIKLTTLGWWTN